MSSNLADLIQYFHDCYRSDNREMVINDFLDRKVEDRLHIDGEEELITANYPIIPIDQAKAESIVKKLEVFEKEKELIYGAFFICGYYTNMRGERKRLCSPLFYYPADIRCKDELYYLSIRPEERRLNYPLVNLLSKDSDGDILQDKIFKDLPSDFIKFENVGAIASLCNKYFPDVDFKNIYGYPLNSSLKSVKSTISKLSKDKLTSVLLPTSMVGIVSKSTNTRGVLNELCELSAKKNFSVPLKALFHQNQEENPPKPYKKGFLPMILSEAQEVILKSGATNPITLIVGPPGTGKSYTIGALAIEHMIRGESVLIASRTDEAVDVIKEKITSAIKTDKGIVRAGKKRAYSTPLNKYLKALLTRANPYRYLSDELDLPRKLDISVLKERITKVQSSLKKRSQSIEKIEKEFAKEVSNELKWGAYLSSNKRGIWASLYKEYLDFRNKIQTPIWKHTSSLSLYDDEQIKEVLEFIHASYVERVMQTLLQGWNTINAFHQALKLSSDTERLAKFDEIDFSKILQTFPIWLINISEVKDVLPFQTEMFDVVIIDEATQCDMASCLPLIQRAKRVVFAGDPHQLRHVSFLSKGIQSLLRTKYNLQNIDSAKLNYRDNSVLDLAMSSLSSGNQVATLDEHFRSITPIIQFSNEKFYEGDLRIMTSRPDETEKGLYFISCKGTRNKAGSNEKEASNLLKDVRNLVTIEQELPDKLCTSIGILSPFRAQVDLLAKRLMAEFSISEIEKHNIRVGTAYSFQGEERDHMYLSFAVDSDTHHSALYHLTKEDVFNVSITRARNKQFIYTSIDPSELDANSLLRAYLLPSTKGNHDYTYTGDHDSFLKDVIEVLKKWNIDSHWVGFPIAGLKIDLLVKHNNTYLGIDLVGYPGEFDEAFGVERYRILNRAGIKIHPLPYSDWYFERKGTQKVLKEFLMSMHTRNC